MNSQDKIYKRLAQEVANIQYTIDSLDVALIKARNERDAIISKIETELQCENFKELFTAPQGSPQTSDEKSRSLAHVAHHAFVRTLSPQEKLEFQEWCRQEGLLKENESLDEFLARSPRLKRRLEGLPTPHVIGEDPLR